jgi:lipopolysaccharide transport system permease protein
MTIPTEQADPSLLKNTHLNLAMASPGATVEAGLDETVIRPRTGWVAIDWGELYRARELLYYFVWRDIKVRYKQTVIGVAWAVLQPLFTLLIFSVVFGRFVRIPEVEVPYPVFAFAGLIPWMFFSQGVGYASSSLVSQQQLLSKIYFPRLFLPTAAVGVFLVDLAISLALYAGVLAIYGVAPSWQVVALPAMIALMIVATLGTGYTLAALTAFYRDFRPLVGFLLQVLMYLSPVIYPASLMPHRFRLILALNPMYGIIDGFRSAVLGPSAGCPWHPDTLAISTASALALFAFGLFYFRKAERIVVDIV